MVMAMQFTQTGGPEVLQPVTLNLPTNPQPGQVLLRQTAIGLNYIDTYHRSGLYAVGLPAIPGMEGAGVVEAVGEGVDGLKPGDRVAYGRGPMGGYAEKRFIHAKELIPIPEGISDEVAASVMLKGLTAWYLLHTTFPVAKGDKVLVHAAAGGVGLLLSQWAAKKGALVIGTAGSPEKAQLAKEAGCASVILYRTENVAERVRALTNDAGVDVVYDAVGRDTFTGSLDSLKPQGMMVSYGQASGEIPPFDLRELSKRGSLFITRPSLMDLTKNDNLYRKAATELLAMVGRGDLAVNVAQRYALRDAAKAHAALESRATTGSTVLIP
jgi:NADPH2:quinone reductase